ncbi:NADPH-dependent FMN reductase [Undibacterium sp. Xuan67W]|uniref:NADPH-dependent FMN reductase n=1 Tax=Undibacterium sp. Xuan67W TaxID=3413057 RepID=UPI003BF410C5
MTILLLSGSPSLPSRSARLLHYVGERLTALGFQTSTIQVRDLPAQALLHADFANPELLAAKQQLAEAQAVVIATPIYKAAYRGLLKTFLDILPQDGLAGKLVLPLATGGSQSHMLALDYALRPVLASLAAAHILPSVYAIDKQVEWSEQHGTKIDPAILERLHEGVRQLDQGLADRTDTVKNIDTFSLLGRTEKQSIPESLRCSA